VLLVADVVELNGTALTSFSMRSYALKEHTGFIYSIRVFRKDSRHTGLKLLLRSF
jgi:hypothetical protein